MSAISNRYKIGSARGAALLAMLICATLLLAGPAWASAVLRSEPARVARSLEASDTAKLRYVSVAGSVIFEEGNATGTLPGKMRASVRIAGDISGSFTFYLRGGTMKGRGSATPHGSGSVESFSGSLTVTGGTGRYVHARGHAGLYGTFNRANYALLVQTTGSLSY